MHAVWLNNSIVNNNNSNGSKQQATMLGKLLSECRGNVQQQLMRNNKKKATMTTASRSVRFLVGFGLVVVCTFFGLSMERHDLLASPPAQTYVRKFHNDSSDKNDNDNDNNKKGVVVATTEESLITVTTTTTNGTAATTTTATTTTSGNILTTPAAAAAAAAAAGGTNFLTAPIDGKEASSSNAGAAGDGNNSSTVTTTEKTTAYNEDKVEDITLSTNGTATTSSNISTPAPPAAGATNLTVPIDGNNAGDGHGDGDGNGSSTNTTAETATSTSSSSTKEKVEDISKGRNDRLGSAMDEAVRLLFSSSNNETLAQDYIQKYPGPLFRFYVYDNLPEQVHYRNVSKCIENKWNPPGPNASECGWGSGLCTVPKILPSSNMYLLRRFNRNADTILSELFLEYKGELRTYDPSEAHAFIVPYPSTGFCACRTDSARCQKAISNGFLEKMFSDHLMYYNASTAYKHVFMHTDQMDVTHPYMLEVLQKQKSVLLTLESRCRNIREYCGHLVIPYTNTNPQYQPSQLDEMVTNEAFARKKYVVGSAITRGVVFGGRFGGAMSRTRSDIRQRFVEAAIQYFHTNSTNHSATMPVRIAKVNNVTFDAAQYGEMESLQLYQQSVFCPVLRGDTPAQKRFFDALLSGCIPLVIRYKQSDEVGYPSYFEPKRASIRRYYPFARGSFTNMPEMGIDYESIVFPIDSDGSGALSPGNCTDVGCIFPTLENLMLEQGNATISKLQDNIRKVVPLLSYGLDPKTDALRYPDSVVAMLVQIRHQIIQQEQFATYK